MTHWNRFWIFISDVLKCWSNMFCDALPDKLKHPRKPSEVLLAGWLQVVSGLSCFNDFLQVFDNQHETCWLKASTLSLPRGLATILTSFLTSLTTHVMTVGENWPTYGSHLGPGDPSISPSSGVGCSSLDYPWDVNIARGSSTWDSSSV